MVARGPGISRLLVYRCIESMRNADDVGNYRRSMVLLYGEETVRLAAALLDRSERFFGLETLGADMEGSAMHKTLLAAYDKMFAWPNKIRVWPRSG